MKKASDNHMIGLSKFHMEMIALVCLVMDIISKGVIRNGILHIGDFTSAELLEAMQTSERIMFWSTLALVFEAVATCAVPVIAYLTMEYFTESENFMKTLLKVCILALICEIPYNLAISGTFIDMKTRNCIFSIAIAMVALYFYKRFEEKAVKNTIIKIITTVASFMWCFMLNISMGVCILFLVCVLWLCRKRDIMRNLILVSACALCSFISPFYLASPMGVLAIHFYNREKESRISTPIWLYPSILLIGGIFLAFAEI